MSDRENRENWDKYFFDMCNVVASNSKCLSRHIGAVLVKDKTVISTGYNGPPKGVPSCDLRATDANGFVQDENLLKYYIHSGLDPVEVQKNKSCPRYAMGFKSGQGLEWCVAGHAERNTLIQAARNGISTKGTVMYMNCPISCTPCLVEIINAGVEEIVCTDERAYYDVSGEWLVKSSGIKTRTFSDNILKGRR